MRYLLAGMMVLGAVDASWADAPYTGGEPDGSRRADLSTESIHDLAAMTPAQALALDGKRVAFRVEVIEPAIGDRGVNPSAGWCRCAGNTKASVRALVSLDDDVRATGTMTVEATLRVDHLPAGTYLDGTPTREHFYFVLLSAVKQPAH